MTQVKLLDDYVSRKELLRADKHAESKDAGEATVGLQALDSGAQPDSLADLINYTSGQVEASLQFYSSSPRLDVRINGSLLTFSSAIKSIACPENDRVVARLYRARFPSKRAVVLLPHWNAAWCEYRTLAGWLARLGITCLQLSLPYHDERQTSRYGYARELVNENLGETIRSNRQAVLDARACLAWLSSEGYTHLGLVGVSLGSSIAALVASHDSSVRTTAFLLMADDFAEVVWTGTATRHIRQSLERRFSLSDVRKVWALISPNTFAGLLSERMKKVLIVAGAKDGVFMPYLTQRYVERLRTAGMQPVWTTLGCGHYTLGMFPYNVLTFMFLLRYLRESL